MRFEVSGKFRNGLIWTKFRKIIDAENERLAIEKTYSLLGSNHKVKRNLIKIESVRKSE